MKDLFDRFLRWLGLAAGGVLLLLTLVTVADVVLRYVFNAPLASAWEFTEFSISMIVFLGIAYCGWTGGHISIDLLEHWLDRPALRILPAAIAFLGALLMTMVAYRAMLETFATINQVSNMLRWPHYPFRFTAAFGSAMFAVVLFWQGLDSLRRRARKEPADAA